ncbi:hypothetical protein ACWCO9_26685 [Streptomyces sp. NPDC001937]
MTGDRYPDLAFGADFETIGAATHAGNVWVLRGGASGLTGTGAQSFNQGTSGVPGANESSDMFGDAIHLADRNKDGRADLSVVRAARTATTAPYGSCAAPPEAPRPPAR